MELATPPPAARAPVAWHSWWLMPLGLGGGTIAATFMSSERITAAVAGFAVTAAGTVCVRLLLRTRAQLSRAEEAHRNAQAEHSQQWQQHVAGMERNFVTQLAAQEGQLAEQARTYEAQLAEQATAFETRFAEQAESLQERVDHYLAAVSRLGEEQLPDAMRRLRAGDAIDDILPAVEQRVKAGADLQAELGKVIRTALIGIEAEIDRSTSAEQAVIGVGNRIHVLTSKLRGRLHDMQGEHGRLPAVAGGLMELDQAIGPADCLAASIGVLGGSDRPGRQWQDPQRLLSVVRGGIGRIKDFQRVQVRHLPELGVDGGLVDHLTLIFAHLLDNAARYSPPAEPVVVSGKEVPNGVGIEIQDSGKGLSEEKKSEAEHALAGSAPGAGLGGISEDANIGLRVVGILARRYGIRVTFADSPWLGTSVVVVVPHKYFSPLPALASPPAPAVTAPETASAGDAPPAVAQAAPEHGPVAVSAPADEAVDTTPGGLPRRRSRRGEPATGSTPSERADRAAVSAVPPDASFAGLAAFAAAGRDPGPSACASPTPEAAGDRDTTAGGASTEHRTEESD
ncbi:MULTISPECIES: ATP-binding protein [unclassified Streptomyces]|uniref:ATP-binding protein n=1 Tax=unclassified Streptomyces TaxID=2593676 RepID=UPI0022572B78|nr:MULTISPECIES: ATP-binding protein [unclassified Streptomyces]WSP53616.1 ATP-binding protein [Streptomyces sp. NBC_01241]WSU25717.1 ATP-binding protein [Streptomyces sp. NBC_01108]MCX4785008.1 ATP-binding protein [Streptomyces sp. NBC_01221]MCX4799055.1 ATP-binding protein [Streptomyces sp. NBC_01242]WSJ40243.1 ATP-binding protein [Streptomyces sp. NBC_01321]